MYKYIFLLLSVALQQASASIAVATCNGVTDQGPLSASCSVDSSSANVAAASSVSNDAWPILDLSFGGPSASASFYGDYHLAVSGVSSGSFAPALIVADWNGVSISIDGINISAGQGTRLISFFNGGADFTIGVSGPPIAGYGDSVEIRLFHLWDAAGHSITPNYTLTAANAPIPEPSSLLLLGTGLFLILASRPHKRQ